MRCESCEIIYINGVRCHENGCPEAYKDEIRECKWCGMDFVPEERNQFVCSHSCAVSYADYECDCSECTPEDIDEFEDEEGE